MSLAEFDLIRRFFTAKAYVNSSIRLGVGDDCALLSVPAGFELAVTVDTMVQGVHFLPGTDPKSLGHKLLAVNLSDLAAMGAEPVAVLLALTLPEIDEVWLEQFSAGFMALAERYSVNNKREVEG
ncbi:MAG: thiamine-phosphate kinase [Gammaproteobacteria bacterium]